MRLGIKKITALSVIGIATILSSAKMIEVCSLKSPVSCNPDSCKLRYCLGPENYQVNTPGHPLTCNGDWVIELAGVYWRAQEDGLEYAICNEVIGSDGTTTNRGMNNLVDSEFLSPNFSWDVGFKLGVGYNTNCDGWDFGLAWTHFSKGSHENVSAEFSDNRTLLPLWSAFQSPNAGNARLLFATNIETFWKLELNLVDFELGRLFWTGHRIAIRPFIGFRYASLDQDYTIRHRGGSWENLGNANKSFNNLVDLQNEYWGVGIRSGLNSIWNVGCGWGLYADLATSTVYGRFSLDHHEYIRLAQSPFSKTRIYEAEERFRASRAMLDLGLGVQWGGLLCDCKYGVTLSLGWEQHLFFHQNQMWKVKRIGGQNGTSLLNSSGENTYSQSRGTLSTAGWTLKGSLAF